MPLLKPRPSARHANSSSSSIFSFRSSSSRNTIAKPRPSTIWNATPSVAQLCVVCKVSTARADSVFCGATCMNRAQNFGPHLAALDSTHPMYTTITQLFSKGWSHDTPIPVIEKIYAVVAPENRHNAYRAYRHVLLHVSRHRSICSERSCSLCGIIRNSYDISWSGQKWGRYGRGIYTTCTSSKAADYARTPPTNPLKALILNDVVIGKGAEIAGDMPNMTEPPSGYDSVLAVPSKRLHRGGAPRGLNYDETVVYNNSAIRPMYIILYLPLPA
ncbi:SubName: Full=Uncharacterized protein {ECO:0000313/EMBL:CCA75736.1} [Serendipita indica DSM 11827]|nr:SubName: Full=Uncharacterized protein {ECO:0000313/EMBL:CCA75736.1} [Serendipita indica DSM 11827]